MCKLVISRYFGEELYELWTKPWKGWYGELVDICMLDEICMYSLCKPKKYRVADKKSEIKNMTVWACL